MKAFVVPLADLERGPKHADWPIDARWLDLALEGTEAQPRGTGRVDVILTKDGQQVIVKGRVTAPLVMPCARTLDPVQVDIDAELLLMLSPTPGTNVNARRADGRQSHATRGRTVTKKGPSANMSQVAKDRIMADEDAAQDSYSGDEIVLDAFIRESVLLELPMAPLRSDLRAIDNPAIAGPLAKAESDAGNRIDPRLAPLAEIAGRLKLETKE